MWRQGEKYPIEGTRFRKFGYLYKINRNINQPKQFSRALLKAQDIDMMIAFVTMKETTFNKNLPELNTVFLIIDY